MAQLPNGTPDALSVCEAADSGIVITGAVSDAGGYGDLLVMKFDGSNGNTVWTKTWAGTIGEVGSHIERTSDNGFFVTGSTSSAGAGGVDMVAMKLDASGSLIWAKTIGGTGSEYGYWGTQTSDGGYVLVGETASYGAGVDNTLVVKLTSTGTLSWARAISAGAGNYARAYSVVQAPDGGYAIAGDAYGPPGYDGRYLAVKLTSTGAFSWARITPDTGDSWGQAVANASDGGFVVCGFTYVYGQSSYGDMMVLKLEADGTNCLAQTFSPDFATVTPTVSSWTPSEPTYSMSPSNTVSISSQSFGFVDACPVGVDEMTPEVTAQMWSRGEWLYLYLPRESDVRLTITTHLAGLSRGFMMAMRAKGSTSSLQGLTPGASTWQSWNANGAR